MRRTTEGWEKGEMAGRVDKQNGYKRPLAAGGPLIIIFPAFVWDRMTKVLWQSCWKLKLFDNFQFYFYHNSTPRSGSLSNWLYSWSRRFRFRTESKWSPLINKLSSVMEFVNGEDEDGVVRLSKSNSIAFSLWLFRSIKCHGTTVTDEQKGKCEKGGYWHELQKSGRF